MADGRLPHKAQPYKLPLDGRQWALVFVGFALVVAYILWLIGSMLEGAEGGAWGSTEWAAFGQMATAVVAVVGLAGVFFTFQAAQRQTRSLQEQLSLQRANLEPLFALSTVSVHRELSRPLNPTQAHPYSYRLQLKNAGGIAYAVRATLEAAGAHPIADRSASSPHSWALVEAGNLHVPEVTFYGNQGDREAASSGLDSLMHTDTWACKTLTIDYINFEATARRQTYRVMYPPDPYTPGTVHGLLLLKSEDRPIDDA